MALLLPSQVQYGRVRGQILLAVLDSNDADDLPDGNPAIGSITFTPEFDGTVSYAGLDGVVVIPKPIEIVLDGTGSFDEKLVANAGNPSGWSYLVSFNIVDAYLPSFSIEIAPGSDQTIDDFMPLGSSSGVLTLRGPQGVPGPGGSNSDVATYVTNVGPTRTALNDAFVDRETHGAALRPNRHALPPTVKLVGANIVVKPTHTPTADTRVGVWGTLFVEWDWTGWIKWQVDLAASVGANAIRLIGDYHAIKGGRITQATYLEHWTQLLDYCATKGLYVYPNLCAANHVNGATPAELAAFATAFGTLIEPYENVIGIDMYQEAETESAGTFTDYSLPRIAAISAALAAVTTVPRSVSMVTGNESTMTALDPYVDLFDLHNYSQPDPATLGSFYQHSVQRPIIVGEIGSTVPTSDAARRAVYEAAGKELLSRASVLGVFAWAIADQDLLDANNYGMFAATGAARSVVTEPFSKWRKTASSRPRTYTIRSTADSTISPSGGWIGITTGIVVAVPEECTVEFNWQIVLFTPAGTAGDKFWLTVLKDAAPLEFVIVEGATDARSVTYKGVSTATLTPGSYAFTLGIHHGVGSNSASVAEGSNTLAVCRFTPAY